VHELALIDEDCAWNTLSGPIPRPSSSALESTPDYTRGRGVEADENWRETLGMEQHSAAALPALPCRANFSRLHLSRLPEDVPALRNLRSEIRARARLLSWCHVRQLRIGAGHDCHNRGGSLGRYFMVHRERCCMGVRIVPAAGSMAHAVCPCAVDLSGPNHRSGAPVLKTVEADPIIMGSGGARIREARETYDCGKYPGRAALQRPGKRGSMRASAPARIFAPPAPFWLR